MMRLNPTAFGVAVGIVSGGTIFVMTLLHLAAGWFEPWVKLLSSAYMGQGPTFLGALAGLIAGFIDGLVVGIVAAAIYNGIARRLEQVEEPQEGRLT